MSPAHERGTSAPNGRLRGARARDWSDVQEGQCGPAYEAVFDSLSLRPGTTYCDVGCGAGMAALHASRRGAEVSGIDTADGLIGIARERVAVGDFRLGDLEERPFRDGTFDFVTGFNSFQFAADPVAALTEARRVSKPTGRIVVLTWGNPQDMEAATLITALKPLLPPPPPGSPGPFALSDENASKAFAEGAGLTALKTSDVACEWFYKDLRTAMRGWARQAWQQWPWNTQVSKPSTRPMKPQWRPSDVTTAAIALGPRSCGCWPHPDRNSHFMRTPSLLGARPGWAQAFVAPGVTRPASPALACWRTRNGWADDRRSLTHGGVP